MWEGNREALRVDFDGQVRFEFDGSKITGDAVLPAYRELAEALELTAEGDPFRIHAPRAGQTTRPIAMARPSIYGALAGYEHANDARFFTTTRQSSTDRAPGVSFFRSLPNA